VEAINLVLLLVTTGNEKILACSDFTRTRNLKMKLKPIEVVKDELAVRYSDTNWSAGANM
jgi:hypothetical protein